MDVPLANFITIRLVYFLLFIRDYFITYMHLSPNHSFIYPSKHANIRSSSVSCLDGASTSFALAGGKSFGHCYEMTQTETC